MSRRPSDLRKRNPAMDFGNQAAWDVMREKRTFTINDVWELVDMTRAAVANYIKRLKRGGYLSCDELNEPGTQIQNVYHLVKDCGRYAPRLKFDGSPCPPEASTNMWRSMRGLSQFSATDIAVHSNTAETQVSVSAAKSYISYLMRAGYLRVIRKASANKREAVYKLINDTGPLAPRVQRTYQLFDQNTDAITPIDRVKR